MRKKNVAQVNFDQGKREEHFINDLNTVAGRPVANLSYSNMLFSEAMRSAFDRINPVDLANMDEEQFSEFSRKYKKAIQRVVRLTLEAQL